MSLRIRMARGGAKKRPFYRIVIADSRSPRDGRFIERIGSYDPMLPAGNENRVKIDLEKAKAWLAKGALPSDRVGRFLAAANVYTLPARPEQSKQAEPKAKAKERAKERADKAAAAEAAPAAAETPAS